MAMSHSQSPSKPNPKNTVSTGSDEAVVVAVGLELTVDVAVVLPECVAVAVRDEVDEAVVVSVGVVVVVPEYVALAVNEDVDEAVGVVVAVTVAEAVAVELPE
jgi:hypothetical protein